MRGVAYPYLRASRDGTRMSTIDPSGQSPASAPRRLRPQASCWRRNRAYHSTCTVLIDRSSYASTSAVPR